MNTKFVELGNMDIDTIEVGFDDNPTPGYMILKWSVNGHIILAVPKVVALKLKQEIEKAETTIWKEN